MIPVKRAPPFFLRRPPSSALKKRRIAAFFIIMPCFFLRARTSPEILQAAFRPKRLPYSDDTRPRGETPPRFFRRFLKFKAVRLQSAPPAVAFIQILKPYIPKSFLHGLLLTLFNHFATSLSVKFSVPKKILLSLLTVCHFLPYQPESLIKSRPHFFG